MKWSNFVRFGGMMALVLSTSMTCLAATVTVSGKIQEIDLANRRISVQRVKGEMARAFDVAPTAEILAGQFSIDFASLEKGDAVFLTYDTTTKQLVKIEKLSGISGAGVALFNGKSLDGWTIGLPRKGGTRGKWTVDPKQQALVSPGAKESNWLESKKRYQDFRLSLEFRIPPGVRFSPNGSGVMIRVVGRHSGGYDPKGIEIDINEAGTGAVIAYEVRVGAGRSTSADGIARSVVKPNANALKPAGEWNAMVIECVRDHLKVTLNDVLVNEVTNLDEVDGKICLRNEGTPIEFRNIIIEEQAEKAAE